MEADLSQDAALLAVFRNKIDGHSDTAKRMFGVDKPTDSERAVGKTINFLIVNRGGGAALLEQLKLQGLAANDWVAGAPYSEGALVQNVTGAPRRYKARNAGRSGAWEPRSWYALDGSIRWEDVGAGWRQDTCEFYIKKWYEDHSGVGRWHEELFAEARRHGFIRNWSGRIRYCPEIRSSIKRVQEGGTKQIANFGIQAGAQDTMKIGMALLWGEIEHGRLAGADIQPLVQVHDDCVSLVEDAAVDDYIEVSTDVYRHRVVETMASVYGYEFSIDIDAECKVGKTWGSVKKVKA